MSRIFRHIAAGAALIAFSAWTQAAWRSNCRPTSPRRAKRRSSRCTRRARSSTNARPSKDGKFAWSFREPIATLLLKGKTVGRHYAGPNWEYMDGSAVVAKVAGRAPGKTPEGHSLAQARGDLASRQGHASRTSPPSSASTPSGGQLEGACRHGRHVQQRGLRHRLRVPAEVDGAVTNGASRCRDAGT